MDKLPISVVILTYNDEINIQSCMAQLDRFKHVYVIDSFSNDRTTDILASANVPYVQRKFLNYSEQRNWAQDNLPINSEWVFHLDSDERVTSELIDELKEIFTQNNSYDGFMVSRKTVFMNKWIRHGGHYPAYHLRIYKRKMGHCENRLYDQHFVCNGKIRILKSDIIDTITNDFDIWKQRMSNWAKMEAMEIINDNKTTEISPNKSGNPIEQKRWMRNKYYSLPMFIRSVLYFLYRFFIKLGFLDGKEGFRFHFYQGFWFRYQVDKFIMDIRRKTK